MLFRSDGVRRDVGDDDVDPVARALEAWMPGAARKLVAAKVCMYSLTPDRNFVVGITLYFTMGLIMYATLALLAPYLQTLMDYPVVTAGIVLAPRGAGLMLAAPLVGRLVGRISPRLLVGIGFGTGAVALYQMTSWTPDVSEGTMIGVGFLQGLSIGFMTIPINIITYATLPSTMRTEAAGIYSLMRNLGSAIGISITGALLETNTQVNHADIAEGVTLFNRALQSGAASHFWNPATIRGAAMLDQEITRQSQIIAYVDDFKLMLVLGLIVVPLLLLTRSPQRVAQPAPAKVAPSAHKWQGPPQQTLNPERRT